MEKICRGNRENNRRAEKCIVMQEKIVIIEIGIRSTSLA